MGVCVVCCVLDVVICILMCVCVCVQCGCVCGMCPWDEWTRDPIAGMHLCVHLYVRLCDMSSAHLVWEDQR